MVNPKIDEQFTYYAVDALTPAGLHQQMRQRGPKSYWGYSSWWVSWTARCQVSVDIRITLPRHSRPNKMTRANQKIWSDMTTALLAHERQHGQHAINAGHELIKGNCRSGNRITNKWANQDRIFDRTTKHGSTQGVDLK